MSKFHLGVKGAMGGGKLRRFPLESQHADGFPIVMYRRAKAAITR